MARDFRIPLKAITPRLLPKKYLSNGEYLLFESRQHRTVWLSLLHKFEWLVGVDLAIYVVIPAWPWLNQTSSPYIQFYQGTFEPLFLVFNSFALYFWPFRWLKKRSVVYAVTNKRIIRKWGILLRRHKDIPVSEIDDLDLDWSPMQRAMDYGKLEFRSANVKHGHVKYKERMEWIAVPKPAYVRRLVLELAGKKVPTPNKRVKAAGLGIANTRRRETSVDSQTIATNQ